MLWFFGGIFVIGLIAEIVFGNPRKGIKKKHQYGAYSGRSVRVERPQVFEDTDDEDSEDEDWFSEDARGKRRGGAVRVERPHVIEDTDYECSSRNRGTPLFVPPWSALVNKNWTLISKKSDNR